MVKILLSPLRRWTALERFLGRIARLLRAWPADDFGRFVSASVGTGMAGSVVSFPPLVEPFRMQSAGSIRPASFEMRFMKLQAEGRFGEMWEMLADDAQRAWGGREAFIRDMPRMDEDTELLDVQAISVSLLEDWTDHAHQRTYSDVARLVMRYRVRRQWREWTFDRQVHLIATAGGWRTLCYPPRIKATGTAVGR
jgi:hypothetical protein